MAKVSFRMPSGSRESVFAVQTDTARKIHRSAHCERADGRMVERHARERPGRRPVVRVMDLLAVRVPRGRSAALATVLATGALSVVAAPARAVDPDVFGDDATAAAAGETLREAVTDTPAGGTITLQDG